jgi:hypothetical protein
VVRFERGEPERPKGHALLYFSTPEGDLLATYVVVLPLEVDLTKYMPPFLASQMGGVSTLDLSSFAFPPVPERVPSREALEQTVGQRDDDLIFGGEINPTDTMAMVTRVAAVVQEYARLYTEWRERWPAPVAASPSPEGGPSDIGVQDVLYAYMDERERVAELARLVSKLRFAVEGADPRAVHEAEGEVYTLAKHLGEEYQVHRLLQAVKDPSPRGARLAQWHLERMWKVAARDWEGVRVLEEHIAAEEGRPPFAAS